MNDPVSNCPDSGSYSMRSNSTCDRPCTTPPWIWPSGTRFEAGESLRLVIQGTDFYSPPKPVMADRHEDSVNRGWHVIRTGGKYDSHLLVPVVPEKPKH